MAYMKQLIIPKHSPLAQSLDDNGKYKTWVCRYEYDGFEYGIDIRAKTLQEAEDRLRVVSAGFVEGILELELPFTVGGN